MWVPASPVLIWACAGDLGVGVICAPASCSVSLSSFITKLNTVCVTLLDNCSFNYKKPLVSWLQLPASATAERTTAMTLRGELSSGAMPSLGR